MAAPLVPLVFLWIAGLLIGAYMPLTWVQWLKLGGIALILGIPFARHSPTESSPLFHPPIFGTLLALALTLGSARSAAHRPHFDHIDLATYNDLGRATVQGTIVKYPETRGTYTRYEVVASRLWDAKSSSWKRVEGHFLVTLAPHPAYEYGDLLELSGDLVTPPVLDDFDYRAFLAHKGIYSLLRNAHGTLVESGQGSPLFHVLFNFRKRAEKAVQQLLPEPYASLMSGILLGIESGIPTTVMEAFNETGTTHILIISGSNLALIATLFLSLGRRLFGERWGSLLAIVAIILYTLLVGGDPPVVRAAIMGIVAVFALLMRREGVALNTLALTVLLMTAWQPGQLYDIGFQLSVLATLGLILFVPPLTSMVDSVLMRLDVAERHRGHALGLLSDAILITLAAQIITTPLIVGTFGRFSIIALLSNLLILPVQGWLMVSGGLATLAGMLWLPLGKLIAWIPYAGIAWTVAIVRWTATFPYASLEIGALPTWAIWWVYALWGVWWWSRQSENEQVGLRLATPEASNPRESIPARRQLFWCGVVLIALVPWWIRHQLPDGHLHLYALDVGQGDALLIVTPDGKQILVDSGPDPVSLLSHLGDYLPPWDHTLELVILTHADADHLGGLPELLSRYRVGQVVDSGFPNDTPLFDVWLEQLQAQGLRPLSAQPEQQWQLGEGVTLEVLAPTSAPFEQLNNNSVVTRLHYGHFCALLTGDIEAEAEARLVDSKRLTPCQVLKVAHHGSRTSSTEPFLNAVRPTIALISAGRDNRFGHPHGEVIARLEAIGVRIFRTDEQGTIHLVTNGRELWVKANGTSRLYKER
ncbi:MAG: DNA internalization-related competence protein ComEC/Rec2 [Chloroflexota bacterium]|nr:DNA internalization-related competence protein ComEC/Rec2 [Chloroflexota bacterium]